MSLCAKQRLFNSAGVCQIMIRASNTDNDSPFSLIGQYVKDIVNGNGERKSRAKDSLIATVD